MEFMEFYRRFKSEPYVDSRVFSMLGQSEQMIRNQVSGWKKKGLLVQLKKGLYVFSQDYKPYPEKGFVANLLLQPSYLSLEYALSRYGLIPDIVRAYTSVSTKKTCRFENKTGSYIFRHVKEALFFGYVKKDGVLIASPEKALLDHIYLSARAGAKIDKSFFLDNMRIQNTKNLNIAALKKYASRFGSGAVSAAAEILEKIWKNY